LASKKERFIRLVLSRIMSENEIFKNESMIYLDLKG
jgi:hypothetical protein